MELLFDLIINIYDKDINNEWYLDKLILSLFSKMKSKIFNGTTISY